jgi:hypothetical protein
VSVSQRTANWPASAACVAALLYAAVSFYWAFGGTAGIGTLGGRLEELGRNGDPAVLWLAGIAGVLKVAGAVMALALVRPWGRVVPRRVLLGAAWAGAVVLVGYGGLYVAGGALALGGVVEVAGGRGPGGALVARAGLGPLVSGVGGAARAGGLALRAAHRSTGWRASRRRVRADRALAET